MRLLLCVLLATMLITVSPTDISAQPSPRTEISGLKYPTSALVGTTVVVSFDVTYSMGQYAYLWLMSALACGLGTPETICAFVSADGVSSSPFPCNPTNPFGTSKLLVPEFCYLTVSTETGGVEHFAFQVSFTRAGNYSLTVTTQLNQPGFRYDENGSMSISQHMMITVHSQTVPEFSELTITTLLALLAAVYLTGKKKTAQQL